MKLKELPQVMALSAEQKLDLIDELWESIYPEAGQIEISDEEKRLLDERLAEHRANPASALSLNELKQAVAQRLK